MTTRQLHQPAIDLQETIWEVDDALWERLEPLLKIEKVRKKSGRPARDARMIFNGLIWIARTGSQWSQLPARFGPKSTAYDRFKVWVEHGQLQQVWAVVLNEYDTLVGIDWEWQAADGCIIKAPLGKRGRSARRKRPEAIRRTEAKPEPSEPC